jgi:DNA-binding response OmpR family regulator
MAKKNGATRSMANSIRKKKRILFVEDNDDAWEIVENMLAECKLTFTRNFDNGLRLARQGYFDLYILDNWLPDGSGIGLCRAIREFDPYTPILFYSAAVYERDIQEALRSGAQAYLVKPVKPGDLEQAVAKLTSPAGGRESEACRAEIAVIREELAIAHTENFKQIESARERRRRAEEKLMRLKAEKAFLDAGGTRGEFARRWPSVLTEEVRCQRASDAANDNCTRAPEDRRKPTVR